MAAELVGPRVYSCCNCRNHVCLHDDVISKAFQGRNGRAFLFSHAMNVVVGAKEDRQLMTGLHTLISIARIAAMCWAGNMREHTRRHRSTRKGSSYSRNQRLSKRTGSTED